MLTLVKEEYVPSTKALANRWARFGLTDAAIAEIAKNQYLVLTDDLRFLTPCRMTGLPPSISTSYGISITRLMNFCARLGRFKAGDVGETIVMSA